jgi:hypothetical protein
MSPTSSTPASAWTVLSKRKVRVDTGFHSVFWCHISIGAATELDPEYECQPVSPALMPSSAPDICRSESLHWIVAGRYGHPAVLRTITGVSRAPDEPN